MLRWRQATVTQRIAETDSATTLVLDVPGWTTHRAGQHVDLRLTAPDGYQATRSYSVASAPARPLAITVQRVDDGEVSPFLADVARPGTAVEVRGPVGGWFVWEPNTTDRVVLLAGGSGIVPLASMLRHRRRLGDPTPFHLVYSARTPDRILYRDELAATTEGEHVVITLTGDDIPPDWDGETGRVDAQTLRRHLPAPSGGLTYVCGPTAFVEAAAASLAVLGYGPTTIRTERFG
ncbi:ferredoxin reductase [Salsipaludibacter albus]|uniref:ferredoxin reductase n=1 Tax=Salsipaludibacter albus TaxID=2849650 RepID=UPI001EE41523|nr:ferredoxin reductase [Salsipaludibacter albus]MBY5163640.1 ferredoxin reductase [Salsipaludibacter albus]